MAADFVEPKPLHKLPLKSGKDILEGQYRSGRSTLDKAEWARDAFDGLRRRCAHVPEDSLVRLFHGKTQSQLELIQGEAIFLEYNATHQLGRKRVKVRVKPAPRAVVTSVPAAKAAPPKPKPAPKKAAKAAKAKARPAPKASKAKAKAKRKR
jgi:hypothetical protein